MSFNWSNAVENAIAGGLGLVPEVGSLLSSLVYIFWPSSGPDVWSEIKADVEALIEQDIDNLVYQQAQQSLAGLKNNLDDYRTAVSTGDLANISSTWITTDGDFDQQLPNFQASGYQLLLLPLFAQFANLNLALLHDGVEFGETWGWNAAYRQSVLTKLQGKITAFTTYANLIYQSGYQSVVGSTGTDYHACQPFRSVNAYVRGMTLGVQDFVQMWPYFDPSAYPNPVAVYLDREIYSDPVGTCDDSGAINLPSPPTQPISQISVWAWDRIDGVQLTYPAGGGPGGVTTTARMGDQGGGSNGAPHGGVYNVAANPITIAGGASGDILNSFIFTFRDGSSTGQLGGNYPGGSPFSFSYGGEILSSVHINGISQYYGSADCAVFGFKYEQSQARTLDALRLQYVASPTETSLEALAGRSAASPVDLEQLTAHASAQGWEAERQAYLASRSSAQGTGSLFAVRRGNQIIYQADINDTTGTAVSYGNGNQEDEYLAGDWTGDGKAKFAVRRGNQIIYQANISDTTGTAVFYGNGNSEDQYLVGDWTGDGKAKLAVRRGRQIIYQADINDTTGTAVSYGDGNAEDQYLAGDWTGDGKAKFAVRRGRQIIYQTHITDTTGTAVSYGNGNAEDQYLVGDWTGDGKAKLAVRRGRQIIYQAHVSDTTGTSVSYGNGNAEDQYLVGDWTGGRPAGP